MSELQDLRNSVDGLRSDVQSLGRNVASLEATSKAETQRVREEVKVLFGLSRNHGGRIGEIEKSYVPRDEHKADMEENRGEHHEFRDGLDGQRTFSGRIAGGVAVAVAGLSVLAILVGGAVWLLENLGAK